MKYTFIVNPISGQLRSQELLDYLNIYRKSHPDFSFDIHLTQHEKHAIEITKQIYGEDQVVVACGGDGTVNEVLNGLNPEVAIAVFPIGTGNDFFKMVHSGKVDDFKTLLNKLFEGTIKTIDVGLINGEKFINVANFGLDASVVEDYNKLRKSIIPQQMIYTGVAVQKLFKDKPLIYRVHGLEPEPFEIEATLGTIANGRYYGGGYQPAPMADLQDGLLNVSFVRKSHPFRLLHLMMLYKKGSHINMKEMSHYLSDQLTIESDQYITYVLDGELRHSKKIEIACLKNAVKVLFY